MNAADYTLFENEHFSIEHSFYYRVAGFLFVVPKREVTMLGEMTAAELALLGPTLAVACDAVQEVMHPINVYCAKFGESDGTVHFHIFPRTKALTQVYLEEVGGTGSIDAPRLMSWSNNRFLGSNEFGEIEAAIEAFRRYFSELR